jgi:hypothetical protein
MPTHTLMENRCWCLDATVAWRMAIHPAWVLRKFTIPSLVNPASSVYRTLATKCVYNAFCEKPLTKHHPCTVMKRTEGLHSLDVVRVKWLFMENSPDKGNTGTSSSCNSSQTGSGIFFHSSQYMNFSKNRPYLSRHWFLGITLTGTFCSFKWVLYLLKCCNPF